MKAVYSGSSKDFERGKEYNLSVVRGMGGIEVFVENNTDAIYYNSLLQFGKDWKIACKTPTTNYEDTLVKPKKRKLKKSKRNNRR